MAKVYNEKTVSGLRDALKSGQATLERLEYEKFFTGFRMKMAGIRIELYIDKTRGRRVGQVVISNHFINTEYTNIWKQYSPGKFLIADWQRDVCDKDGQCPYFLVHYKAGDAKLRAIVRELFENAPKMREEVKDFELNGHVYTIIKICPDEPEDESWLSGTDKIDIVHTMHIDEPEIPEVDVESEPEVDVDVATTYINF